MSIGVGEREAIRTVVNKRQVNYLSLEGNVEAPSLRKRAFEYAANVTFPSGYKADLWLQLSSSK